MGPARNIAILGARAVVQAPLICLLTFFLDMVVEAKLCAILKARGSLIFFQCTFVGPEFRFTVVSPLIEKINVAREIVESEVVVRYAAILSPNRSPDVRDYISEPQLVCGNSR